MYVNSCSDACLRCKPISYRELWSRLRPQTTAESRGCGSVDCAQATVDKRVQRTEPSLKLLHPARPRVFDRRVKVDDLVLNPDLVPERDDLDETVLALVAGKADPSAGRLGAGLVVVVVGSTRELGRPLANDERDAVEQDLFDSSVELENPAVEVGVTLEVEAVDLAVGRKG